MLHFFYIVDNTVIYFFNIVDNTVIYLMCKHTKERINLLITTKTKITLWYDSVQACLLGINRPNVVRVFYKHISYFLVQ